LKVLFDMRVKFTTTLDSELLEKVKIQAIKEKTDVSKIFERLIEQYLNEVNGEEEVRL